MRKQKKKKRILVVGHAPGLDPGKLYEGVIRSAAIEDGSNSLRVAIENLEPTQAGRIHVERLPEALFPGSKTARFLAAAGQDVDAAGNRIDLNDTVGAVVGMRFYSSDGSDKDIEFERIEPAIEDKAVDLGMDTGPEALL